MTRYSAQPRDRIFVKGYGFLSFGENMRNNIGKNISKNLSSKYSQKLLDNGKQSGIDDLNCFKNGNSYKMQKQLVI